MSRIRSMPSRLQCVHALCLASWVLAALALPVQAQENVADKVKQLTEAMKTVQAQLDASQKQLEDIRRQLAALQAEAGTGETAQPSTPNADADAAKLAAQVEEIREKQAMQESQIAVQDQTKVESESKYPVKVSGLVVMNAFVNTADVDMDATPTLAVSGPGSTGATLRQTILGLDMRGPHLLGARSHGDLRIDFDGSAAGGGGYTNGYGINLVRLRTAHAALDWEHTEAFFSMDRPILSPNIPDSLTAIAEPPLAWSGNLWNWSPQAGVTQDLTFGSQPHLRAQAAFIDLADAPYTTGLATGTGIVLTKSTGEASRWPGVEARIAGGSFNNGLQIGVGGLFAPHRSIGGTEFDSWAGTLDYRFPLLAHMELTGSFYRGQALGGLGAGAYKDYVFALDDGGYYFKTLDDVGGWTQWKQRLGQRFEFNEAVGADQVPAGQLRPYAGPATAIYQNVARNRTVTGNVIFSPSAYLLFSLEYRRIASSPVIGPTATSDVIGVAAGYKF
ncbi:MAG TPA: prefoldin domain-containing protein [Terracidiphilus sp.]|nr:prefoldin domain-containing protein [Terracidiphilus sp.]